MILTAVLYIVALRFCSGKTIPIKNVDERAYVLTAQNADVAQTIVNKTYFDFINLLANRIVLYMFTTGTFAHAQNNTTFEFDFLIRLLRALLRYTLQTQTNP